MEILYFLAGSVMHHSGVVKAPQRRSSGRGWFKAGNHSIHTARNTSGGTRRLGLITIKKFIPCIDQPPYLAVFLYLHQNKKDTSIPGILVGQGPLDSNLREGEK
ncbi:hypothetical protein FTV93_06840 [Escherichia coli]|uniref:Uncharacterized protein n=1 Tax=Escherichia coli TaxID=562 RepID=A0A5B9AKE0_ECOLX|nr:hypothetical protein FTV93_06840 [Escherichia coli]